MSTEDSDTSHLPSSKLGTQDYWDAAYRRELVNFASHGHPGEVWFGQEAATLMLDYLRSLHPYTSSPLSSSSSSTAPTILDIGTGNGHLLFNLCTAKFPQELDDDDDADDADDSDEEDQPTTITSSDRMCGIDYSSASIQLCKDIAASFATSRGQRLNGDVSQIRWSVCDVLDFRQVQELRELAGRIRGSEQEDVEGWDVVLDKGTLDAIALAPTTESSTTSPLDTYIASLARLTRPGGLFLITSCNFTAEELTQRVAPLPLAAFCHLKTLPPKRQYMFGGRTGSTTVCVAFRRNISQ